MSAPSLFRPESIEGQRRRLWGEVIVVQPVGHGVLTAILSAFTVASLVFLVTGSYAKTETVPGYIAPSDGLAQVYAHHGGIIARVMVHEGDLVVQGQALIELSLDTASTDGSAGERLRDQTRARIREIESEMAAANARLKSETKRLSDRAIAIRAELASIEQRSSAEATNLALQEDAANRVAKLEIQGYRTALELNQRQQQVQTERAAILALRQQQEQRRGDLKEVLAELEVLSSDHADRLAQLRGAREEQNQALTQQDVGQRYVLLAPVTGRVAALQAEIGQAAGNQTPLLALVPEGSGTEAHLLVPSRSAGMLQMGQEVRLRVDAFPYQRFGMVTGHIARISRATYRPGELLAPIQYQETVYRVVVDLDHTSIMAYGKKRSLEPGMTMSADVVTDRRHFIDWVLDPLRAVSR